MDTPHAAPRLRLRDPREQNLLAERELGRIAAGQAKPRPNQENAIWRAPFWPEHRDPATYDQLVVAEDRTDGSTLAVLGADVLRTEEEEFLHISTAFVAPVARGQRVLRRMIASAMLQAAREGAIPRVVAARSLNPMFYRSMQRLARQFGAGLYPGLGGPVVQLRAAALARRVARRISPNCRFEPGSGVLRGSARAHGLSGAIEPVPARVAAIDNAYAARLEPDDQFLVILDLRGLDAWDIMETARRIRRRA